MTDATTKFQASFKITPASPLINVYATTAEEFGQQLDALGQLAVKVNSTADTLRAIDTIAQEFKANQEKQEAERASAPPVQGPGNTGISNPVQAAGAPPTGPQCAHGAMVYKTGTTKSGRNAGKEWKAWMCPAQKDGGPTLGGTFAPQCPAQWL